MMKRVTRRSLIIGALLSLIPNFSSAAGPTLVPKKVGQTIIWRGRKYTAIKSGNKIIWNKGVPIVTNSPIKSPSATASATPSSSIAKKPETSNLNIVGKSSDIAIGETKLFSESDPYGRGARYLITRTKSGLVAFDNTCTHEGCGIETILPKNQLQCKCHGAEFDALTGEALKKPASQALKAVTVSEVNGEILIG
jgi:nitrite reductase/ring-hydroxylating ferredoxin subunit